ncbi:MAG: tyrosine-type recombinase/integrase [Planctomycetota bacterium]
MARIFRQQYTAQARGGRRVTRQSRKWYVEYADAQGIRRRVPGYTDRKATEQLATELERQSAREQSGLVDQHAEHRRRLLAEHVADWRNALLARGRTGQHVRLSASRVERLLADCRFVRWADISASRFESYLADRRADGLSAASSNHYLRAVKSFCTWLVKDGRAPSNPLAHLSQQNEQLDKRHERRALTDHELRRLFAAANSGPAWRGMAGPDRAMLYWLAVETGLRASELRMLAWGCLDLYADTPTVTVKAAYSKHRRDDVLPLKPDTAAMLLRCRESQGMVDPDALVFPAMPAKGHIARMLRADLAAAGIDYCDDAGKVADFHCLRHTFISNLARGGVHPKIAQQLARHSTIALTMDRYTHTVLGELSAALTALPDLSGAARERGERRATGTYDGRGEFLPTGLPKQLASEASRVAPHCTEGKQHSESGGRSKRRNRRRWDSNP